MTEEWRIIKDHPNYVVSDHGRVMRIKPGKGAQVGKILKAHLDKRWGYYLVSLGDGDPFQAKTFRVHQLVCEAFHGPRPKGKEVNHKDSDRTNNHAVNLEWMTRSENIQHGWNNGGYDKQRFNRPRGEISHLSRFKNQDILDIRKALAQGQTLEVLAQKYGTSFQYISMIKRRKVWKHI